MGVESRGGVFRWAVNLWRWRRLVATLAAREVRLRYAGSLFGVAWTVLEPFVQFGMYLWVFGVIIGIRFADQGIGSYGVYLLSGLIPFLFFQETLTRALGLARSQVALLRSSAVPLEVLLAGSYLAIGTKYITGLVLLTGGGIAAGTFSARHLDWLVVALVVLGLGTFGVGLVAVTLGAFVPDASPLAGLATMAILFASPILYPLGAVPEPLRGLVAFNPLVGVLEGFRGVFLGAPVAAGPVLVAIVAGLACVVLGSWVHRRRGRFVRDVV